jgi:amidase
MDNGIIGIKPTIGLISRTGVIPISHTQDTAGPMARTVRDAAILLGVLAGFDPEDKATEESRGKSFADYTQYLDPKGLQGARIGIVRKLFGFHSMVDAISNHAIDIMKQQGAMIIDPADIATLGKLSDIEMTVLLHEFKAGLKRSSLSDCSQDLDNNSLLPFTDSQGSEPEFQLSGFLDNDIGPRYLPICQDQDVTAPGFQ